MNLLQQPWQPGFPIDYLAARIQGRRNDYLSDWTEGGVGNNAAEGQRDIRDFLQQELAWVYRQMDAAGRRVLEPVYLAWELRNLSRSLRCLAGGDRDALPTWLENSLLRAEIQEVMRRARTPEEALKYLDRILPPHRLLTEIYAERGWRGLEMALKKLWTDTVAEMKHPRFVGRFLQRLIDWRNLRTWGLYQRWEIEGDRPWLAGGSFAAEKMEPGDEQTLNAHLARLGLPGENWEKNLLGRIGEELAGAAAKQRGLALILHHLWRLFIEARNRGLVAYGRRPGRERVAGELVA